MIWQYLDTVDNWNPQLIRELKLRLTIPNIAIAITISLLAQTVPFLITNHFSSQHSPRWWLHVSEFLNREIWLGLAIGGTYAIAKDLDREIRSGTLDLINLSPITPTQFLLGKLLGVPILIYGAVAFALPLHLVTIVCISSIDINGWAWDLISLMTLGLLYLNAIFSIVKFSLPPIIVSLCLTIGGWLWLTIADTAWSGRQSVGDYDILGFHFHEQWWTIAIVMLTAIAINSTRASILATWYVRLKSPLTSDGHWLMAVGYYSCLLLFYTVLVGLMPLQMLGILIFFKLMAKIFGRSI
jgi:hypothetical protein